MGGSRKGRKGTQPAFPPTASESRQICPPNWEDPWATRRAGLRRVLRRARWLQEDLDRGRVENAAALAQREGVSRARISQLLRLLRLAPAIQADLDDVEATGPAPQERDLRLLTDIRPVEAQVAAYRQLCTREGAKVKARRCGSRRASGKRDYADLFDRARRYHEALASKKVKSLTALARAEGLSGGRVGQVMVLLYLAPDIIEQVESAAEPLPGVTQHELRRIARIRDQDRQRREFAELVAGGGAASPGRGGPGRAS